MRFSAKIGIPSPKYIETDEEIEVALRRCFRSKALAIDTETLGKGYGMLEDQIICAGFSPDKESRFFVPRTKLYRFKSVIEDEGIIKVLHNYKFDAHRFDNCGITIKGPVADTLVMDWLWDEDTREGRHSLKICSLDYFGIQMDDWKDIVGKANPADVLPGHESWERMLDYGTLDAWVTRELYELLKGKLEKIFIDPKTKNRSLMDHYWDLEEPQLKCLYQMERRGINIDREYLESLTEQLNQEMEQTARKICEVVGRPIKPGSTKELSKYLFEELGLESTKKTPSGAPSCDESVLTYLAEEKDVEVCKLVLKYRKAAKTKGTYAEGLLKKLQPGGHLHTSYSTTQRTGRLASKGPNLQNIPRPSSDPYAIRNSFIPEDGCVLIVSDYAQLEMRVMAEFSGDEAMVKGICEGLDMHSYTAALMMKIPYEEFIKRKEAKDPDALAVRQAAKAVGFGIIFCQGARGLSESLTDSLGKEVTVEDAQAYLDGYLSAFPGIKNQISAFQRSAKVRGFVQTICGRYRRLSKIKSKNFRERGMAQRQAVNSPIQGSAADIVRKAMLRCWRSKDLKRLGCTLRMQVHDELVFNCPEENAEEALKLIQHYMENPFKEPLRVPLPAEPVIVSCWGKAK